MTQGGEARLGQLSKLKAALVVLATFGAALPETRAETWQEAALVRALDRHRNDKPEQCDREPSRSPTSSDTVETFDLWFGEDTAARDALLVRVPCRQGAYNVSFVFYLADEWGAVSAVTVPSPQVEIRYRDGSDERIVEKITLREAVDAPEVVNARFDPDSRELVERDKWRARDDAYTETKWGFRNGRFELIRFAVDATFNGRDDPVVLISRDIW